jgi:RNA polymerase sigma factor (sigma-70 family)
VSEWVSTRVPARTLNIEMSPVPRRPVGRSTRPGSFSGADGAARTAARFESEAGAFLDAVGAELVGALTIRVGDRRLAEELASEAIARAWADWSRVSAMENPTGWVFRVGFNLAASHWRRAAARRRIDARHPLDERSVHVRTAEAMAMHEAISRLSDQQQRVVILRYYAQFSVEETAEALRVSESTVKTQTARAMTRLRALLGDADADR